jgi:hypothetical protein
MPMRSQTPSPPHSTKNLSLEATSGLMVVLMMLLDTTLS